MIAFIFGVTVVGEPNVMKKPHVLSFDESNVLRWSDPLPGDIGGGYDNLLYRVEACGEQALFVQSDEIVGNPYAAHFVARVLPMYRTFNDELKAEV